MIVDPGRRGRGVGRALMEAVRARVAAARCTRWYLNVRRDNAAALRLYERCGLRVEREAWALAIAWDRVGSLPGGGARVTAFAPGARDEGAICARFGLEPERLARCRESGHIVACGLREGDSIVGFASFDPTFPGAFPFCVARGELARPLLEAMKPHADLHRFPFVRLRVEDDPDLVAWLRAAGADVTFELVQMGGAV